VLKQGEKNNKLTAMLFYLAQVGSLSATEQKLTGRCVIAEKA
jgi:hypothetical protein